ncbi:MAG: pyridoxamine 5'-phosphate oxidase, partial [Gemmatimonadaceae bacterium]|nr:pyridoxamine 5'-phosphate oxidase [Gemmatimonadaceae bacterium]
MTRIADLRQEYARHALDVSDVDADPIVQFRRWFDEALAAQLPEPNAMTLATVREDGTPDARIVLLKGVDARGFAFFTDFRSQKGQDLAAHPHAALVFHWHALERQVRIRGDVTRLPLDESAAYYASRPRGSRVGAWASVQSSVLADRTVLEGRVHDAETRFAHDEPPLPPHWGGYLVAPVELEFWQGRPSR